MVACHDEKGAVVGPVEVDQAEDQAQEQVYDEANCEDYIDFVVENTLYIR